MMFVALGLIRSSCVYLCVSIPRVTRPAIRLLQIFYSVLRFSKANFLIFQPIPMLSPFVGIVSLRRFQQMVTT